MHTGPKVLRAGMENHHGFGLRGPDRYLKSGEGCSLKTRRAIKELLRKQPVNRDPIFRGGTGGVRLSWESVPRAGSIFRWVLMGLRDVLPNDLSCTRIIPILAQSHILVLVHTRHLYDNGTIDFAALRWTNRGNEVVWGRREKPGLPIYWHPRPTEVEVG